MKINDVVSEAAAMIPPPAAQPAAGAKPAPWAIPAIKQASASAQAAPGAVAQAAPGAVKTGSTNFPTKKVLTPDQIKQYNAKQAAATQPAQQQPAAAPATAPAQQQPAAPRDTSKDHYDTTTGELTAYGKAEQEKKSAYYAKLKADAEAQRAQAIKDFDARQAQQNPAPVAQQPTGTSGPTVTTTDPAEVKAAMQAQIDAMKQKNPKLAAQMAALGLDDAFNEKLAPTATAAQPAQPVAEDVRRMIELAGLAK